MARTSAPVPPAARVLALAQRSFDAAREALDGLDAATQAAVVCEAPLPRRVEILELLERPEDVVPLLPDAELCFTARAVGLADAGPLLRHASLDQIRTAVDLDAWRGLAPDREVLSEWLEALAEAGDEKLLEALRGLDRELVVLWLRDAARVWLDASDDQDPPDGAMTLDGQFFLVARRNDDHLELIMRSLRVAFEADYGLYVRLLLGAIHESDADCEEYALRWRTGRLEELGFPAWEEAMRVYGHVPASERGRLDGGDRALPPGSLPAPPPWLPARLEGRHALFRAAAELEDAERESFLRRFLQLANQVAVADALPLGDPASAPEALERAAATASLGLEHVARETGLAAPEVLRRATLLRLHRVGASLASEARRATREGPHRRK